jgi:hypothetical protein
MKKTHIKIDSHLKRAGFGKVATTEMATYWIIPITGRMLCLTDNQVLTDRINQLGGLSLPSDCTIVDIVHQLSADEHILIENLI